MPADRAHTPYPSVPRSQPSHPNIFRSHTSHPNISRRSNISGSHTLRSSTSHQDVLNSSTSHSQVYHDHFDTFIFKGSKAEDHWASKDAMSLAQRTRSATESVTKHLTEIDECSRSVHVAISNVAPVGELVENVRQSTTVLGLFETIDAFTTHTSASSAQSEQRVSELITETRKTLALLQGNLAELQKIKSMADALKEECCRERIIEVMKLGHAFVEYEEAIGGQDGQGRTL